MTTKKQLEATRARAAIAAFSHEDTLLMHRALAAYAGILRSIDREFPNPDQRRLANRADALSDYLSSLNQARDFVIKATGAPQSSDR